MAMVELETINYGKQMIELMEVADVITLNDGHSRLIFITGEVIDVKDPYPELQRLNSETK